MRRSDASLLLLMQRKLVTLSFPSDQIPSSLRPGDRKLPISPTARFTDEDAGRKRAYLLPS